MDSSRSTGVLAILSNGGLIGIMFGLCMGIASAQHATDATEDRALGDRDRMPPWGVCPPFHLRDEEGNVINPVVGENADKPYSPKQTCGQCHDYETITQGYHFTQGAGEAPTDDQQARCLWATTPGSLLNRKQVRRQTAGPLALRVFAISYTQPVRLG